MVSNLRMSRTHNRHVAIVILFSVPHVNSRVSKKCNFLYNIRCSEVKFKAYL